MTFRIDGLTSDRPASRLILAAALACGLAGGAHTTAAQARGQVAGDPAAAPRSGCAAPAFTLVDVDSGARISNDELAGRWVLIDFWATWCGPCVAAVPDLEAAHAAFAGYGFDILSISLDNDPAVVTRFRERRSEMPWMHAVPAGGMGSAVARAFGVRGIPAYFLIAPDGSIAASGADLAGRRLEATLQRLLFSPAPH